MSGLNGRGPEDKGPKTGRGLGNCRKPNDKIVVGSLGKGLGKRRKSSGCDEGQGKRLQSGFVPDLK